MLFGQLVKLLFVNCRIGSLEKQRLAVAARRIVNCRIGSLEIVSDRKEYEEIVNCRIGSLENSVPVHL